MRARAAVRAAGPATALTHANSEGRSLARGRLSGTIAAGATPSPTSTSILRDAEVAENGTWRWVDPEGRIARAVGDYFLARHEDGRPPPGESATSGSPQP